VSDVLWPDVKSTVKHSNLQTNIFLLLLCKEYALNTTFVLVLESDLVIK